MCFHRNYRVYYSKRRSLKVVSDWRFIPSNCSSLDDCDDARPILLTVKTPLSIVVELANKYGAYFTTNAHVLNPDSDVVLQVYSKEMAVELIKRGSRVVVLKWTFYLVGHSLLCSFFIENKIILVILMVLY